VGIGGQTAAAHSEQGVAGVEEGGRQWCSGLGCAWQGKKKGNRRGTS
jgi:hypothetical protein